MKKSRKEPVLLVVNTSLNLLNLFHELLENDGFEVELSNYTFEGLSSIEQLQPDLIIMDFDNEGMAEQWQLLQIVKMHESTADIPIVLVVLAIQTFREQADHLQSKNIHLLYKPFEKGDLLAALYRLLPRTDSLQ